MTESVLKSLMRLFAIVAQVLPNDKLPYVRSIVDEYLKQLVSHGKVNQFLIMFDFYYSSLKERNSGTTRKQLSLFYVKVIIICEHINQILTRKQRLLVVLQLLEMVDIKDNIDEADIDLIKTISLSFNFDEDVFKNCKAFVIDSIYEVPNKNNVLVVDSKESANDDDILHLKKNYLKGKIVFLSVEQARAYLFRNVDADDSLYYKGKKMKPFRTYFLEKGATIRSPLLGAIYYSDVVKEFLKSKKQPKVDFAVDDVAFKFPNSENGVHAFSLHEESGMMVGIMGGSGVGKSTLLNILNGNIIPDQGNVKINGYDVHKNKSKLKGIIGYIPQDDLLIEELTVYQNIYYNALLCFRDNTKSEIDNKVTKILADLNLYEIKDLKVGNPLNKFISGGQRKRLNIALELIREPYVLFVDEPTSGLSSSDSDLVIDLLKEQSLKGKLVVINIHQPSSDIYKRFDKLIVMDKGGRIVFHGNPLDALVYFKTENQLINADDGECLTCGNVNPEQVLEILESKKVDQDGDYTSERRVDAETWYQLYKNKIEPKDKHAPLSPKKLPRNDFNVPSKIKQLKIFSKRNLLSKLSDKQYLIINLLEAPALAFLLGWFTKYNAGTASDPNAYVFSENMNLPVYIFMSVIVAIFLGLMVSAEEIIRDRKILQREKFLSLSSFSYYNSKVLFLACLSAIQMFSFVLIGNNIMEIKGMAFQYWLILFVCAVAANLLGLNISANLKSVVAIYILIPLLIVPQILFGGAMIRFENLNSHLTHPKYVPLIGDLMFSRWAYEGLAVYQFKENDYQKIFFELDQKESHASYMVNYLIPELTLKLNILTINHKKGENLEDQVKSLNLLRNELTKLLKNTNYKDNDFISGFYTDKFNIDDAYKARKFLVYLKKQYNTLLDKIVYAKDNLIRHYSDEGEGAIDLINLKREHFNLNLEKIMLNRSNENKIIEHESELIRLDEPIFKWPEMKMGRAHFFAPEKRVLYYYIDTYWFDIIALICWVIFFYLMLVLEIPKKMTIFLIRYNIKGYFIKLLYRMNKKKE